MQSEEFDKKAREAAEHHHPAYDEQAWAKMEKLLDKHLPQKDDDRRRIIFFLLFFLLLGGGIWSFISKPWQHDKKLVNNKTLPQHSSDAIPVKTGAAENKTTVAANPTNTNQKNSNNIIDHTTENKPVILPEPIFNPSNTVLQNTNRRRQGNTRNLIPFNINEPGLNKNKTTLLTGEKALMTEQVGNNHTEIADNNKAAAIVNNTLRVTTDAVAPDKAGNEKTAALQDISKTQTGPQQNKTEVAAETPVGKKTKTPGSKNNSLFFTISAGPDISAAGSDRLGTTKLLFGGGVGYTFHDKFTIRTGFYAARKIYTAAPYEYHPPAAFWTYYPNLEQVNADCKVYEIPLLLSYNFSHSAKENWFATTGLSSYLMKQETYDYSFKNAAGQQLNHKVTFLDKNKHYFSVLTLSGGYQRNINKTFSLMVEPYAKIPLTGIGYGKVKLNSAGVLVSVGIKAFSSKKKSVGR